MRQYHHFVFLLSHWNDVKRPNYSISSSRKKCSRTVRWHCSRFCLTIICAALMESSHYTIFEMKFFRLLLLLRSYLSVSTNSLSLGSLFVIVLWCLSPIQQSFTYTYFSLTDFDNIYVTVGSPSVGWYIKKTPTDSLERNNKQNNRERAYLQKNKCHFRHQRPQINKKKVSFGSDASMKAHFVM